MVLGGTGSVEGSTGQYKMVLDQCSSVMVDTLWYWVSMGQFFWYLVLLDQYRAVMVDTWWYRRLRRLLRRLYIVNAVLEASGRQALLL